MGIELELAVLLGLAIVGPALFGRFEVETSPGRKLLKWGLVGAGTLLLFRAVGHWALALPLGLGAIGLGVHYWWCGRHGIDPLRATPRRRYYELRGWDWQE